MGVLDLKNLQLGELPQGAAKVNPVYPLTKQMVSVAPSRRPKRLQARVSLGAQLH